MNRHASESNSGDRPRIVVAGGGVAALEAVLALRTHAGDAVDIQIVCPSGRFDYRPLSVLQPFDVGQQWSVDIAHFAEDQGATWKPAAAMSVDPAARLLRTDEGEDIAYDALLLTIGCRMREALPGASSFGGADDVPALRGILEHLDLQESRRLAFVAPDAAAWLVPLYELALLARARLSARGANNAQVSLITAEQSPLEMLGEPASDTISMLLAKDHIELRTAVQAVAVENRAIVLADGEPIPADHVFTLPHMSGWEIPGLPQDDEGFVPVDEHCAVKGIADVWAAGDMTAGFPKQGGLAARQADAAAEAILTDLGLHAHPRVFVPIIEGVLLTSSLIAALDENADPRSDGSAAWRAPTKIVARFLAPYLETREPSSNHPEQWQATNGLPGEIAVGGGPLAPTDRDRQAMSRDFALNLPPRFDAGQARTFVSSRLGDLAADDDATRHLRESLRSYLAAGCSAEGAAHELGCNVADVRDAIARSEELLHHGITDDMLELRVALELAATPALAQ